MSSTSNPSLEVINEYDTEQLVNFLQGKNLNLTEDDFATLHKQKISGRAFLCLTEQKLLKPPYNFLGGPALEIADLIEQLNNQKLLNLEEYLSCIPPAATYSEDASRSTHSANIGGLWPDRIIRWDGFLDEVTRFSFDRTEQRFKSPVFFNNLRVRVEANIETLLEVNIFSALNEIYLPTFEFSKQKDSDFNSDDPNVGLGKPDFTCRKYVGLNDHIGIRIVEIEVKKDCVVKQLYEDDFDELFITGHASGDLNNAIRQLYNYMIVDELQYGILTSYEHTWFFQRPRNNPSVLKISESLLIQSTNPPVLKTYAYLLINLARVNPESPHPNVIPGRTRGDTRNLNSGSNNQSSNNQSSNQSQRSGSGSGPRSRGGSMGRSTRNQDPETETQELTYGFTDFKLKGILGCGQTGRTFKAIFRGEPVAMKAIDLYKEANLLRKIQGEIDIYKILIKIQGRYIPKLVSYGYYGYGMGYFMCVTIVGTTLNHHKIDYIQKDMAFEALRAIHSHGILHNDIREENILVNDKGEIRIIDFGLSIITDNTEQFYEEECEFSNLLDRYLLSM